jgi:flagellar M-ring protein FliF
MEAMRQIFSQLAAAFKNLGRGKQITLLCLMAGTIAGFIFLMTWSGKTELQPLYANLDPEDAGIILAKLKEQKIPYQIASNGTTILIPEQHIYEIRMQLASEGLPQGSGIGFEVFDNSKLGMTEFAQNINYQRALQGELARTINRIAEVESSRVHIVMPEKSLFIEDEEPATASVVLRLRPGKWLSQGQINGIVHLVSSSIPRLSPERVTVVDSNGKLLAGFKNESNFGTLSSDQLEYQSRVEKTLESRLKTMLESALGENKAIVRLACAFDFKQQEKTEELYLPENRVVRSEQHSNESANTPETTPQGIPGVRSNLPGDATAAREYTTNTTNSAFAKQDRTVNYEIGKVTSRILEPVGELTRVSVAVLVDGTYKQVTKGAHGFEWQYVARTAEEMQKLENIVKRAVNFNASRGDEVEVVNIPFETTRALMEEDQVVETGWYDLLKNYKPYLKYGFLSLFLILSFLFFVRPLVRWLTDYSFGDMKIFRQLPKTVGELESDYDQLTNPSRAGLKFRDRASQLITSDSEASVDVMRDWIKES